MSTRWLVLAVWVVVGVVAFGTVLVTYLGRRRLPTLGALVGSIGSRPVGRIALFAGWCWFGWHAFAR